MNEQKQNNESLYERRVLNAAIRYVAYATLRHRLALNFEALTAGEKIDGIIGSLLN